jgi:hypothetical protein
MILQRISNDIGLDVYNIRLRTYIEEQYNLVALQGRLAGAQYRGDGDGGLVSQQQSGDGAYAAVRELTMQLRQMHTQQHQLLQQQLVAQQQQLASQEQLGRLGKQLADMQEQARRQGQ